MTDTTQPRQPDDVTEFLLARIAEDEELARDAVHFEPDDVRAGLTEAGGRRADARVAEADAMNEITLWLRRGQGVLSITEMSRLSGVTRETIYQLLRNP